MREAVSRLKQDERFAEFRDTPYVFGVAAVNHSSDPEGFLEGVREAISRLEQDSRFADLHDTPSVFRRVAVNNPSDPESYILDLLANRPPEAAAGPHTQRASTTSSPSGSPHR